MQPQHLQLTLFQKIKEALPPHLSLADELGNLLGLSPDSIYRRIRGEKPVTLTELQKICHHFHLSLDQLLSTQSDSVLFQAPGITANPTSFKAYMEGMLEQFRYFNSFTNRQINYICKDVPFWYFYLFPHLAAFKTFFWSKTIHNDPALASERFSLQTHLFQDCFAIGQQILEAHATMNTIELWNQESIHSTVNQLAYYRDAGLFQSKDDLQKVVDSCIALLDHLQAQATQGVKFMPGATEPTHRGSLQFYVNELLLGSNTILLELDNHRTTMITYSTFGYLITRDEKFTARAFEHFHSLQSRAMLISRSAEKERNRFFNTLREKVLQLQ